MNTIQYDYTQSCGVSTEQLDKILHKLQEETERISKAQTTSYSTDYASINLPNDAQLNTTINTVITEKKALNPTLIVIIGIGGSNLGTIAVIEALYGKFYNDHSEIKLYFADTVDTDYLNTILQYTEKELRSGNNVLLNVISKSGTTTETIINFDLFLELLKKYHPSKYNDFIIVTTDHQSALWNYAHNEQMTILTIPTNVGGRYSVFSAVSLFPLALCGIDIAELQLGARNILALCLHTQKTENSATINASILYSLYQRGYVIHDTFLFGVELESIGKWYRQLMAESIGKSHNTMGVVINNGITPTVSIGSTDLHSVAQLYLSGPYNTFTTFVSVKQSNNSLFLTNTPLLAMLAPSTKNKSVEIIMNAILCGTIAAYKKNNRPFVHYIIPQKNAYYIGQFMQFKMIEIMYLGFLMNINPFDQPNVELYKIETKKLLLLKK